MFSELVRFKETYGHCKVSVDSSRHVDLARWTGKQRYRRIIGRLSEDRIALLDSVEFVWHERDAQWQEQYDALVLFRKRAWALRRPNSLHGLRPWTLAAQPTRPAPARHATTGARKAVVGTRRGVAASSRRQRLVEGELRRTEPVSESARPLRCSPDVYAESGTRPVGEQATPGGSPGPTVARSRISPEATRY